MATHKHGEAFMLMVYEARDRSEREQVWNSRDGAAPHEIRSATTGVELRRRNVGVQYLPEHVPAVGDRIFVDLTEQRARIIAAGVIEQYRADGKQAELDAMFASHEEAVEILSQSMLETGVGDLITVTSGYIEELLEARGRGAEPEVAVSAQRASGPRTYDIASLQISIGGVPINVDASMPEDDWEALGVAMPDDEHSPPYYGRQGERITQQQYFELHEDDTYRIVKHTKVGNKVVSTVWLGLDHNWHRLLGTDPIIFETSVFFIGEDGSIEVRGGATVARDHTEAEALARHENVVAELRAKGN
jgi:hypothetical protein